MNEREVWFGLHETPLIGWETLNAVAAAVKDVSRLPEMSETQILKLPLPEGKKRPVYEGSRRAFIEERLRLYRDRGFRFLAHCDPQYPELFRHMTKPPWIIYYRGDIRCLERPCLGIVGTRVPTAYGKRVTAEFASQLAAQGWCIVSGMARGIDGEAHAGALSAQGKTIAVLGTPIDQIYPREHAGLYERIGREGLIMSEYPIGTVMRKGMFPHRNRIIAGLSMGVLVVEADADSGSLITATAAEQQHREVFAVPGPISSPKSRGTNKLISTLTATLVASPADITDEFAYVKPRLFTEGIGFPKPDERAEKLTPEEAKVLSFLSDLPVTFDGLYELTQFDFGHLHSVLISLLMKKKIEQHAGSSYILAY